MKIFKNIALAMLALSVFGCADLDELLENPNGVDPSRADAVSLYSSVQLTFANGIANDQGVYQFAGGLSRMDAETGGFNYNATHGPTEFDGLWTDVYAGFLPDANTYLDIVEPLGLDAEAASVKIMQAYTYMLMVDLFNDVPLSQAGAGEDGNLVPTADGAADVYNAAIGLLDEAIAQLDGADNFASSAFDNFYGGNAAAWRNLANTLKLRAAVTTRLVGGAGGAGTISGILSSGDFIADNDQNFEFTYGTNRVNPNNRHPWYNNSYEDDDGVYQSNWYMWLLAESKGFPDPRARFYFYRQEKDIFPEVVEDDPNAFDCILTDVPDPDFIPPHYEAVSEDLPYCLGSYDQGYFGRDHLNGSGIPPDGQYRTVFGLYPAGGKFDNGLRDGDVLNLGTDGALGAGIAPIWQASFTHFILAEAVLTMGVDGDARALLEDGIELSFDRVTDFLDKVDGSEVLATNPVIVTVEDTYPADSTYEDYIEFVLDEYDDADDDNERLGIIAREYLIALWGNGIEGYNLYRRTCLPADLQPGINPDFGEFIRSALYPAVHVNRNQSISQKSGITQPVFWDTNDASCNY